MWRSLSTILDAEFDERHQFKLKRELKRLHPRFTSDQSCDGSVAFHQARFSFRLLINNVGRVSRDA